VTDAADLKRAGVKAAAAALHNRGKRCIMIFVRGPKKAKEA